MSKHDPPTPPTTPPDPTSPTNGYGAKERLADLTDTLGRTLTHRSWVTLRALASMADWQGRRTEAGATIADLRRLACHMGLPGTYREREAGRALRVLRDRGLVSVVESGGARGRAWVVRIDWERLATLAELAPGADQTPCQNRRTAPGEAGEKPGAVRPQTRRAAPETRRNTPLNPARCAAHQKHHLASHRSRAPTCRPEDKHSPTPRDTARAAGGCDEDAAAGDGTPLADDLAATLRAQGVSPAQARALAANASRELVRAAIDLADEADARGRLRNRGGLLAQQLRNPDSKAHRRTEAARAEARAADARARQHKRQCDAIAQMKADAARVSTHDRNAFFAEAKARIRRA